jgi:hypothetical protein
VIKEEILSQMNADLSPLFPDSPQDVRSYTKPFNFYFTEEGVVVWFGKYIIEED